VVYGLHLVFLFGFVLRGTGRLGEELRVMTEYPLASRFLDGGENLAARCGMICRDCSAF